MICMGKKKITPLPPAESAKKRERSGASIQAFIDPDLRGAMDDYIAHWNATQPHEASVTSTVTAALRKFLADEGFWPRKPAK